MKSIVEGGRMPRHEGGLVSDWGELMGGWTIAK